MSARLIGAVVMCLLGAAADAGAINLDSPIVSGTVTTFQGSAKPTSRNLSADQLRAISAWLAWNKSGWFGEKALVPHEPVEFELDLKRSDGSTSLVYLVLEVATKKHYLFYGFADRVAAARAPYHTLLGMVKRPSATRPVAGYELYDLHEALEKK